MLAGLDASFNSHSLPKRTIEAIKNRRGYALHNFLLMEVFMFFMKEQKALFFEKDYSIQINYTLKDPENFKNG